MDPWSGFHVVYVRVNLASLCYSSIIHHSHADHADLALCAISQVAPDALLPVGHTLTADHFVPGQFVDVIGKT